MLLADFSSSAMGKYVELTRQALQPIGGMYYSLCLYLEAPVPQIVTLESLVKLKGHSQV